jgi:hypothetical protein
MDRLHAPKMRLDKGGLPRYRPPVKFEEDPQ